MNQSPRPDAAERAELARLLQPPGVPELAPDRHLLLKDAFLRQITEPPPSSRRWPARLAVMAAAAVLVAAGLGVTVLTQRAPGGPTIAANSPIVAVAAGDPTKVASLMERVALVAEKKPQVSVGEGEYVYIRSKVAWLVFAKDSDSTSKVAGKDQQVLDEVHSREIWRPAVQGSEGLIRERGEMLGMRDTLPNSRYAELPTDPAALLEKVYAETKGRGSSADAAAFDFLGEALRESLLPPQVAAAIYRAAAKIPGVVLIPDSVDAQGRHGVAVARTEEYGARSEWIFDSSTFEYLGERSYLVRDTEVGKAGMLTATTAVLQRSVVSDKGDRPN